MTKYVDLHVIPRVEDLASCERMAELLHSAKYSAVGLTVPTGLLRERIKPIRAAFNQHGVDTALRIDLGSSSRTELLRSLRRFRNLYDIVAVKCQNQRVATVACRDRRVDLVFFDPSNQALRFTHSFARLLHGALELNLVSDLVGRADSSVLSRLRKAISIAQEHRVNVVLSSAAREPMLIRSPLQISALAATFGLGQKEAIRGVSSLPLSMISSNLIRRTQSYVEEGVSIVLPSGR